MGRRLSELREDIKAAIRQDNLDESEAILGMLRHFGVSGVVCTVDARTDKSVKPLPVAAIAIPVTEFRDFAKLMVKVLGEENDS